MLIFILTVMFLLVSCCLLYFSACYNKDGLSVISFVFIFIFSTACIIMLIVFVFSHVGVEANVERMMIQRDIYAYQLENKIYEDDLIGKKALYDQIMNFNADLNTKKLMPQNVWVGMFYPNAYDDIDPICFDVISEEKHDRN